jgi:hypothetical protein
MAKTRGMQLTRSNVNNLMAKYQSLRTRVNSGREVGERMVGKVVDTMLTSGAAYAAGVVQGRTGGVMLPGGISVELAGGIGLNALGFFGVAEKFSHSLGNGLLAAHFATVGRGQGKAMRDAAGGSRSVAAGRTTAALPPASAFAVQGVEDSGERLSTAQLNPAPRRRTRAA